MQTTYKDEKNILNLIKAIVNEDSSLLDKVNNFDDLVSIATDVVPHGDMEEFFEETNVNEEWFDKYFEYDGEDYSAKRSLVYAEEWG